MRILLPIRAIRDKLAALAKLRGMRVGDAVKAAIGATGVDRLVGVDGKACDGCEKRRESLNRFKMPG